MKHLVKLTIRIDISSQNDQCSLVKWDILNVYYVPTFNPEGDTSKKKKKNICE